MLRSGLVEPQRLLTLFEQIEPELYRYPADQRRRVPSRSPVRPHYNSRRMLAWRCSWRSRI